MFVTANEKYQMLLQVWRQSKEEVMAAFHEDPEACLSGKKIWTNRIALCRPFSRGEKPVFVDESESLSLNWLGVQLARFRLGGPNFCAEDRAQEGRPQRCHSRVQAIRGDGRWETETQACIVID